MERFVALLRAHRKSSGKTVPEIASHMGVSRAGLYWWEGPASKIDPVDLRKLLLFYGCSEAQIEEALRLRSLPSDPSSSPPEEEVETPSL